MIFNRQEHPLIWYIRRRRAFNKRTREAMNAYLVNTVIAVLGALVGLHFLFKYLIGE